MRTRANLVMRLCLLAPDVYLVRRTKKKKKNGIYRRIASREMSGSPAYNRHRNEYYIYQGTNVTTD